VAKITDAEIIELEELIKVQDNFDLLKEPTEQTNPNYKYLHKAINEQEWGVDDKGRPVLLKGYAGCILEGSSRSGKTWGGIDIIVWLCGVKHEKDGCTINIYRETYNEFKGTLYDDFKRRLDDYGLPNKFIDTDEIKSFRIGKSKIRFLGDGKHGGGCDYAFFNEIMMLNREVFDQVEMRCRKFWWADYNPSFTHHWVFDNVEPRNDVGFLRTTFEDNMNHISATELNKILGYEPWAPNTYTIEDNLIMYLGQQVTEKHQPPPHPTNVAQGTADESMWCIYGLGLRGAMKGLILSRVKYIEEWPSHLPYTYGLDFGFTADPTALVRYAQEYQEIYIELLIYQPIDNSKELDEILTALDISQYDPITADSADRHVKSGKDAVYMVRDLFDLGWEISKVKKTKSVVYWLGDMKDFTIHIVMNHLYKKARAEHQNYKWKEINGIPINQPIDNFNHCIDAERYAHMSHDSNNFEVESN